MVEVADGSPAQKYMDDLKKASSLFGLEVRSLYMDKRIKDYFSIFTIKPLIRLGRIEIRKKVVPVASAFFDGERSTLFPSKSQYNVFSLSIADEMEEKGYAMGVETNND